MHDLVQKLQSDNPAITFQKGTVFVWSPEKRQVTYVVSNAQSDPWSLLHEVSHSLLGHTTYNSDIDLLQKEVEAWEKAVALSNSYDVVIDRDFIENCLDSYRDWLHKRSVCPACHLQGIQRSLETYSCINCANTWNVTKERFCRPYRRLQQK